MWAAGAPPLARETGRLLGAGRERRDAGGMGKRRTKGDSRAGGEPYALRSL